MGTVQLRNIDKSYASVEVIRDLSLEIADGSFTVFVGPSGCGKSTLLRMVAGLEDITGGDLLIDGTVMNKADPIERGVAMVFQNYALYPHMNVENNIGFSLKLAGMPREEIRQRVAAASELLQILPLMKRKPAELSGGQRQRVAIGRAIVRNPNVFLFDEPLSNLDAELRVSMRVEIAKLHQRLGNTMIYVTHDQTEAMTLADKIVVMRGGKIEQAGAPQELYDNPDNVFVAGFIGSPRMNFINAELRGGQVKHPGGTVPLPFQHADADIVLGIRPEHFRVGGDQADLVLKVDVAENLGGTRYFYGTVNGTQVIAEARELVSVKPGEEIALGFVPDKLLYFDRDGRRLLAQG